MKIHCTVQEFAKIVRACRDANCYSCAMRDICNETKEGEPQRIEDFITADTIEKEAAQ